MGWLARSHGLQANSVTAIELVTAEGEFVRTDADNDPELFWALRGGGGNFGIVTALEFRLYPLTEIYAGFMLWDWTEAERVLTAWAAVGRRRPRPRHDLLPDHADAAAGGAPGARPRPLAGDDRRRRPGRPGGARRRCARSSPSSTRSRRSPRPRSCACTRTPRSRCPSVSRSALVAGAARGGDRGAARARRPRLRLAARRASSCARSAARCAAPPPATARSRASTPQFVLFVGGARAGRRHGRVHARPRRPREGRAGALARRRPVPQLRRGRRRHRADLRRRAPTRACARSRTASTRRT